MLFPISQQLDVTQAVAVDYDDRDLQTDVPPPAARTASPTRRSATKTFWTGVERDLVDHLVRSRTVELQANKKLKLYSRPGETPGGVRPALRRRRRRPRRRRDGQAARQVRGAGSPSCRPTCRPPTTRPSCCTRNNVADRARRSCRRPARCSAACSAAASRARACSARCSARPAPPPAGGHAPPPPAIASMRRRTGSSSCTISSRTWSSRWPTTSRRSTRSGTPSPRTSSTLSVPLERSDVNVTQLALVWLPVG